MIWHLVAAIIAGLLTGTDPRDLLAIAHHETRWTAGNVTREPGARVSCGAMTPEPRRPPCPPSTLFGDYLAGAAHLRSYVDSHWCRNVPGRARVRCALLGYAGGGGLIAGCRRGPVMRGTRNLCHVARELVPW